MCALLITSSAAIHILHDQGVEFFIDTGFIPEKTPKDIAMFLLHCDGLSKAQIGEYLGEG